MSFEKADSRRRNSRAGKNLTQNSVRVKGVTNKIRDFFWKFPDASTKQCCKDLDLNYDYYKNLCYRIKSETKEQQRSKVKGRVLRVPSHRLEWRTEKPLPVAVVAAIEFEALKRRPRRGDPKPSGEWYVIPNRNRQMQFINDFVSIRVFPKSGTCRVLPRKPMDFESLKIYVQNAFFKAGLDLRDCEDLSEILEPHRRHRVFRIGPVTPFQIDYYKDSLGIIIEADGSHQEHIEVSEDWPTWIKPQLHAIAKQTETTTELAKQISLHLSVMKGINVAAKGLADVVKRLNGTLNCEREPLGDLAIIIEGKKGQKAG